MKILQVSGYPSNGMAANVSKDTTAREVLSIGDIEKDVFRLQNINLFFGHVNSLEYGSTMLKAPTLYQVVQYLEDLEKEKK